MLRLHHASGQDFSSHSRQICAGTDRFRRTTRTLCLRAKLPGRNRTRLARGARASVQVAAHGLDAAEAAGFDVLVKRHPRPALHLFDKLFWVTVSRLWSQWKQPLIVVTPETVIRWHRADFHMYWRLISRVRQPIRASQLASQP